MSKEEAIVKVKELWGVNAFAENNHGACFVGELEGPLKFFYGHGQTWEDAFKESVLFMN